MRNRFQFLICGVWITILLAGSSLVSVGQTQLSAAEMRGRQIYRHGTSSSGSEVLAYVGEGLVEVPGDSMPCANCHGLQGHAKPEGSVVPTDLIWDNMTRSYGVRRNDGRTHPAYTEKALELAIERGLDPAGNHLQSVMPRYSMKANDLADLISYLKVLTSDIDPGITDDKIVLATLVPRSGDLAELGSVIATATNAFFREINDRGGIYNRRFEVKIIYSGETPPQTKASVDAFLNQTPVFALTNALIAGSEESVLPLFDARETPLVGPFTLRPQESFPINRQVFYLFSGPNEQARAVIAHLSKLDMSTGIAAVFPATDTGSREIVKSIKTEAQKVGFAKLKLYPYSNDKSGIFDVVDKIRKEHGQRVVLFGDRQDTLQFIIEAARNDWYPQLFIPTGNTDNSIFELPRGFDHRVYITMPTTPADQSLEGLKEFAAFADKYKLSEKHLAIQFAVYSANKVLVEAIKRAGRDLSRERLIHELEGLYQFQTGLVPALTFGPNRRIGALGARLLTLDLEHKQMVPTGDWIAIDE